ncbi:hypothetical protein pipiens_019757, partial [Culex pipiens pipiens]
AAITRNYAHDTSRVIDLVQRELDVVVVVAQGIC